ncbi:MAG: MFS transporter [Thermodesulfobacteriota bacterium]
MTLSNPSQKRGPVFYGWYVVAVAFVCNFMTTGTHFYLFNAFLEPLCNVRGFTRAQVNLGLTAGGVAGLLFQFVHGAVVMRIGPRRYMAVGALCSGAVFALLGRLTSLTAFVWLYVALWITNGAFCGIVANTAVNNWFVKKKGTALGLAQVGISLSGVILPPLGLWLVVKGGLANAYLVIGIMVAALSPLCLLVVRDSPESVGLTPDGLPPEPRVLEVSVNPAPASAKGGGSEPLWPVSQAVRTPAFWIVGIAYALAMAGVVGIMSQLAPRFMDMGFSKKTAMSLMGLTALLGAAAKYLWGMLCDRFEPRKVVAVLMGMCALGLFFGLLGSGLWFVIAFVLFYGFSMGGVLATMPILVAWLFGRLSFTNISRYLAFFMVLQNTGFAVMGLSFSWTGSYNAAFAVFTAAYAIAGILLLRLRRPDPPA